MSDSVRPYRRQPTRLRRPWDSPSKKTGVGCHFLLQCMKVKSESEVTESCPTLRDPMDCSLPGSSIHGIFQAKSTGVGCHCLLRNVTLINVTLIFEKWLLMAVLGLHCCMRAFSSCGEPGYSLAGVPGLLTSMASLIADLRLHRLSSGDPPALEQRLSSRGT